MDSASAKNNFQNTKIKDVATSWQSVVSCQCLRRAEIPLRQCRRDKPQCRCRSSCLLPLLLLVVLCANAPARGEGNQSGLIQGQVSYAGEMPKSKIANDAGQHHDLLHVNPKTRGLQYVVVYLAPTNSDKGQLASNEPNPEHPDAVVDQRDYAFVPPLIAVRAGQRITFTNSDPANHNVRAISSQPQNEFNVFTGVDGNYRHRFAADPTCRPVRLTCDIHPWMHGWIYVFDHPFYAVTDAAGKFRISGLPAGEFRIVLAQPAVAYRREQNIRVRAGEITEVQIEIDRKDLKVP